MKHSKLLKSVSVVTAAVSVLLISAQNALASATVNVGVCIPNESGGCTEQFTYQTYVKAFYGYAIRLGSALAAVMIAYSGYLYLTSQGDTTKLNKAKEIFMGSFLGFIILITISLILNWIGIAGFNS